MLMIVQNDDDSKWVETRRLLLLCCFMFVALCLLSSQGVAFFCGQGMDGHFLITCVVASFLIDHGTVVCPVTWAKQVLVFGISQNEGILQRINFPMKKKNLRLQEYKNPFQNTPKTCVVYSSASPGKQFSTRCTRVQIRTDVLHFDIDRFGQAFCKYALLLVVVLVPHLVHFSSHTIEFVILQR